MTDFRAAARYTERGNPLPHQDAAWQFAWGCLTAAEQAEFLGLFRAAPKPKEPLQVQQPLLVSATQATTIFQRVPTSAQLRDLNDCLARFKINTPLRMAHFLAQVAHESGGLRWMRELATGEAYEGSKQLGNTQPGDGKRFKGAGAIQLTGRANYQKLADFVKDQRVMEGCDYVAVKYPFTSAGFWWQLNKMNELVDGGANVREVSARVNGRDPAKGLQERQAAYTRAAGALKAKPAAPASAPGLVGPKKKPQDFSFKAGDTHLIVNDRAEAMTAYDFDGKRLWEIPALARGQGGDREWTQKNADTPPGLYRAGAIYRDYEKVGATPAYDRTLAAYGWYSLDLEELEGQESRYGRGGIMIHGGGSGAGWPGAWAAKQPLLPTLGCIRCRNIDLHEKIVPLASRGTIYVSVFQEA